MKHAYLIAAHHQMELLKILLSLLDDQRNDIYLHVDARCKDFDEIDIRNVVKKSRLTLIRRRKVSWGGYSQIQLELDLLREAILYEYSYYHLISGVDLPLKSQNEIHDFFDMYRGKEFISYDYVIDEEDIYNRLGQYRFLQEFYANKKNWLYKIDACFIRIQRLIGLMRIPSLKYELKKGANWFSITHELASYVVGQEKKIAHHFKFSRCCDEVFLQTIVFNSSFKNALYFNERVNRCYNMRLVDFQRGNPYVFKLCDKEMLLEAEELFARKFDWQKDKEIIMLISELIANKPT